MNLSPRAQATLLLTVSFGKSDTSGTRPLTTKEWARFAFWLKDHDLDPSDLLKGDLKTVLSGWADAKIPLPRLDALLGRGGTLGFALEKWQRAGLWIMTRSDRDYPERLKRHLRLESPPVLFGCGNGKLLDRGGLAVVGSRDADEEDLAVAENLGAMAARDGRSIVSGGARGIDAAAMLAALGSEGTAVGVLADSLMRASTSANYRKPILAGDLALATPFNPEAGFNVGNAMARNRYIYCLADAAVAVCSTTGKGGTWQGAVDNLEAGRVPLWVKRTTNAGSGNPELAKKGARWLPDDLASLAPLLDAESGKTVDEGQGELPLLAEGEALLARELPAAEAPEPGDPVEEPVAAEPEETGAGSAEDPAGAGFYSMFLDRMVEITASDPAKPDDIAATLELQRSQVAIWLKRGVEEGKITKVRNPVRYQAVPNAPGQAQPAGSSD